MSGRAGTAINGTDNNYGNNHNDNRNLGFTIVELLIVIVIIGILAAITIVSYTNITTKANEASLTADLANNKKQLSLYFAEYGSYPTALDVNKCPSSPTPNTNYCLKLSNGNDYNYYGNSKNFTLTISKSATQAATVTSDSSPTTLSYKTNCPTGFILVPGSTTYGTSNFCVMKYEAKADDNGDGVGDTTYTTGYNTWPADTYPISATRKLVSSAAGYPVANISQTTAITAASSFTKDCTGCHLISEAEWMTLAKDVLNTPSNWSSGTVGSGFIYSGHNDGTPNTALVATTTDSDGYNGTGQTTGSNQRRTLTLSNGNVIWDMAGNTYEWSAGQTTGSQPGITSGGFAWREYPALTNTGSLPVNVTAAGTGISGAGSWTSTNGIGQIYSSSDDAVLRGFRRGGNWNLTSLTGVLSLLLGSAPSNASGSIGFRVAAPAF